jgi:hypothetical protein
MLPAPVLAADADFNGQGTPAVWQYDTVNVRAYGYDAFGDAMKDIMPGAERTVTVRLRNNTADNVEFRLAANPLTGDAAKALEAHFPGKTADDSLLDAVEILVSHGSTRLYEGTLRGLATVGSPDMYTAAGVSLGLVTARYSGLVTVDLSVPESLRSDAVDTLCAIEWRFIATQYNDDVVDPPTTPTTPTTPATPATPATPGGDSSTGGNNTSGGTTTITTGQTTANDTPVSELPELDVPTSLGSSDADVDIEAEPTLTDSGDGAAAWALMNLLLTILAVALMILLLTRYFIAAGHDKDSDMERANERNEEYYTDMRVVSKAAACVVGVFCSIATILLFILTENMKLPMEIVNKYTIFYVCAVVIDLLFLTFSAKKRKRIYDGTV